MKQINLSLCVCEPDEYYKAVFLEQHPLLVCYLIQNVVYPFYYYMQKPGINVLAFYNNGTCKDCSF